MPSDAMIEAAYSVPPIPGRGPNVFSRDRLRAALTAALAQGAVEAKPHPDDIAVDRFAAAMKAKLKWEREERGRSGWDDPKLCPEEYLARLLIAHLAKGNDGNFEDVANFCMMLHQRGAHPAVVAKLASPPEELERVTRERDEARAELADARGISMKASEHAVALEDELAEARAQLAALSREGGK